MYCKLCSTMEKKIKKIAKNNLIRSIYEKSSIELKDVETVVDLLQEEMKKTFELGINIEWRGLGVFEVRERKGRKNARNPKTGEEVSFEDRSTVFFRPGKELKENLKNLHSKDLKADRE